MRCLKNGANSYSTSIFKISDDKVSTYEAIIITNFYLTLLICQGMV